MRNRILILFSFTICSFSAAAISDETSGKVSDIQVAIDDEAVYFRLETMPTNVTEWFYLSDDNTGTTGGCYKKGSPTVLNRAYSALLTAKSTGKNVKIGYCVSTTGYGVVNLYLRAE